MKFDQLTLEELLKADVPFTPGENMYGLRPRDDSCRDSLINAGDIVVVKPADQGEEGRMMVCVIDGKTTIIAHYSQAGDQVHLTSPLGQTIAVRSATQVKIEGSVVAVIRQF